MDQRQTQLMEETNRLIQQLIQDNNLPQMLEQIKAETPEQILELMPAGAEEKKILQIIQLMLAEKVQTAPRGATPMVILRAAISKARRMLRIVVIQDPMMGPNRMTMQNRLNRSILATLARNSSRSKQRS